MIQVEHLNGYNKIYQVDVWYVNWDNVWGNNVRTASLIDNGASEFGEVDYTVWK